MEVFQETKEIHEVTVMKKRMEIKKLFIWFFVCLLIFVFSTFLHECGHGLSSQMNGVPVSTGFNRVGNVYSFPGDANFRTGFEDTQSFLLDFGVPVTLFLAIVFTIVLCTKKRWGSFSAFVIAGFSLCNSIIRLVPCLISVISSLLTQTLHMEDEIQTGQLLATQTGIGWLLALPAIISIIVSIVCLVLSLRKCRTIEYLHFKGIWIAFCAAYVVSFVMENYLDTVIRINWIV